MTNKIIVTELPAHTSNWLQPCDRFLFGPLKIYYNEQSQQMMYNYPGVVVGKANFTGLFAKGWEKAIISDHVRSGFKACSFSHSIPGQFQKRHTC